MRISRIEVENFRNLRNVNIPLGPGSVIVGGNRAGKSNLLYALRLVLDPTLSSAQRTLGREDFSDSLSDGSTNWDPMDHGLVIRVAIEIEEIEDDPAILAVLGAGLIEGEPMRGRLEYRFQPRADFEQPEDRPHVYEWGIYGGTGDDRVGWDLRTFLHHVHLGALRDVENDLRVWRRSPLRALLESAAENVTNDELAKIEQEMGKANELVAGLEPIDRLAEEIANETERLVGPDQALETSLGVAPPDALRALRSLRLFVDGDHKRNLSAESLGGLNVLYVALLQLNLERQLASEEIAYALVSIEEPEAHLHPHTQRTVFSRLLRANASMSLVVTTHSPHIVSVTPPQSLVILRGDEQDSTAVAAAEADLEEEEWADIARYLDATRGEMVFAKKVLLVEGFAEQVLIPKIAADAGHNLDELGITVCGIHGTHFTVYVRFLESLRIPWAVLTDGDPTKSASGEKRAKALLEALEADGEPDESGIFVGEFTLERDLYEVVAANAEACCDVLDTLRSTAVDRGMDGEAFLTAIKNRKGRFAQRLSASEATLTAPEYVRGAIEYLSDQ